MTTKLSSWQEYQDAYRLSIESPAEFWDKEAQNFYWHEPYTTVCEWDFAEPHVQWFLGGKTNITYNCLDRHIPEHGDDTALIWEPNYPDDEARIYTYRALLAEVSKVANGLTQAGIQKGDRVVFYMPMVPELAIGVLACARIGAIHSVVFAGFSAQALADRIVDASAKMVICADYNTRGAKVIPVKKVVDDALRNNACPSVEKVVMLQHTHEQVDIIPDRDITWKDLIKNQSDQHTAVVMDSEDPLFILYTSGSTGKPKGVVHTTGGYMVGTCYTFVNVFQYERGDRYWCTADIGWITGHSYILYGPLLAGATTIMFEGVPTHPDPGRFWEICAKHEVNQFYTAPTAIRALMAKGDEWPAQYDLSSLRVIGSVGEPINTEAWEWYYKHIGASQCPIVDTWWQTETGAIMLSSLPGVTPFKACHAGYPLPGVQPVLLDSDAKEITENEVEGYLCIKHPWPSMLRTLYGDHKRCYETYFSSFEGHYFTGDAARRDAEGKWRVIGRVDDVINVSGHRLGTAEVENAINEHDAVVESAVVGYPHDIKGQGILAYIKCPNSSLEEDVLKTEIRDLVKQVIGPIAKPDKILLVPDLPKTRSGKIMRRILRKIGAGDTSNLGDISTLLNPEIVELLKEKMNTKS